MEGKRIQSNTKYSEDSAIVNAIHIGDKAAYVVHRNTGDTKKMGFEVRT